MSTSTPGSNLHRSNRSLFTLLLATAIVATLAMVPALLFLLDPNRQSVFSDGSVSQVSFVIAFGAANIVLSAIAITIGLCLEPAVRMGAPLVRTGLFYTAGTSRLTSATLLRCFFLGFGLAVIALLCGVAFRSYLPGLPKGFVFPPIWQGSLLILGASVREEILFRFFALNLLVWITTKIARKQEPTAALVWMANIVIALVFALLHLAPASQLLTLSAVTTVASIALATVAGVVFGWIYWRNGLLLAMFTHATCGLTLYLGVRAVIAIGT